MASSAISLEQSSGVGAASVSGNNAAASTSASSPSVIHPNEWSLQNVLAWLQSLQPMAIAHQHSAKFREHEIEGDVLLQLDADALRDMGITSIGHRLVLLRGVYDLKRRWNVELEPDDWRPDVHTVEIRNGSGSSSLAYKATGNSRSAASTTLSSADLQRALHARDERLWALEDEVARLVDWLRRYTDDGGGNLKQIEPLRPYLPPAKGYPASSTPRGVAQNALIGSDSSQGSKTPQTATAFRSAATSTQPNITAVNANANNMSDLSYSHSPQGAPGNVSQLGFSPTSSNTPGATPTTAHPPISPAVNDSTAFRGNTSQPPLTGSTFNSTNSGGAGSSGQDLTLSSLNSSIGSGSSHNALTTPTTASGGGTTASLSPSSPFTMGAGEHLSSSAGASGKKDKNASGNDTRLRVTLTDNTMKILPASLLKYRIEGNWREYALFICYGSTERCLSYDEKPLLLFQKLKEAKQNPVFMLRHIRDVKSPIAIANAKAAARKSTSSDKAGGGKGTKSAAAAGATTTVGQRSSSGSVGGKVADAVAKFGSASGKDGAGAEGAHANGNDLTADGTVMIDTPPGQPRLTGPAAQLVKEGKLADVGRGGATASGGSITYAIAIFPYSADAEDEFDVAIGNTFLVLNKAKGWWIVQRDVRATGQPLVEGVVYNSDGTARNGGEIKSGYTPAGCLLELRAPLSTAITVPPSSSEDANDDPTSPKTPQAAKQMEEMQKGGSSSASPWANVPIPASFITSTSTPGILLMDWDDEDVHLKKDQRLRVFKRYNHWSYCVEEDGQHTRAWLPSWYIGKVPGSSTSSASRSNAAAAAASASGSAAAAATSGNSSSGTMQASTPTSAFSMGSNTTTSHANTLRPSITS